MAFVQSDLDTLEGAMLNPGKKFTFADGRSVENYDLDQLRRLRADIRAELASSTAPTARRTRTIIGRVGCW